MNTSFGPIPPTPTLPSGVMPGGLQPATSIFGIVAPGRPVSVEFGASSPDKLLIEVPNPGQITELSIFALPGVTLPSDQGAIIYYSVAPFANWVALGTITANAPSTFIQTGWTTNQEVLNAPVLQIGISMEPISEVLNIKQVKTVEEWDKLSFTQLVARDMFKYLGSFAQSTPAGERLILPLNALDRWLKRFEEKFRRNPNFLKSEAANM